MLIVCPGFRWKEQLCIGDVAGDTANADALS
jgi:hypothetical protein